jgi:hypothetical protein
VARRVCDLENLVNEEAIARVGLQRHVKEKCVLCSYLAVYSVRGSFLELHYLNPRAVYRICKWLRNAQTGTLLLHKLC